MQYLIVSPTWQHLLSSNLFKKHHVCLFSYLSKIHKSFHISYNLFAILNSFTCMTTSDSVQDYNKAYRYALFFFVSLALQCLIVSPAWQHLISSNLFKKHQVSVFFLPVQETPIFSYIPWVMLNWLFFSETIVNYHYILPQKYH